MTRHLDTFDRLHRAPHLGHDPPGAWPPQTAGLAQGKGTAAPNQKDEVTHARQLQEDWSHTWLSK